MRKVSFIKKKTKMRKVTTKYAINALEADALWLGSTCQQVPFKAVPLRIVFEVPFLTLKTKKKTLSDSSWVMFKCFVSGLVVSKFLMEYMNKLQIIVKQETFGYSICEYVTRI